MMTRHAMIIGLSLLVAGKGNGATLPDKINLTRGFAVAMAINKNIDLRGEAFTATMAGIDLARSRALYDTLFNVSATGGRSAIPGDPFFSTSSGSGSIGLTQYLPTGGSIVVSTQSGYTSADTSTTSATNDWQSSAGITVTQPLLKNSGRETMELSISLADSARQDSLERFRAVATETVYAAIVAYNHLYTLRQTLEARQTALNSAQQMLEEINKKKAKPGPLQRMETANAEYAVAQRRKDLVDADRSVRDQEASLRYLIGIEGKSQLILIDPPARDEPKETEDEAVQLAQELRTDLKQLRLAVQTSQLQERVASHQALPELNVSLSGGATGTGNEFGKSYRQLVERPGTFWQAGMQLNVPLGNTAASNDYLKSKIRTEQAKNQVAALEWKIRNEVESDMRALISARLQLQTADRSRQYAEQRNEEYHKQNRAGAATVQDVLNADNDLTVARNAHGDAIETFSNAVAKLWKDIGVLLERQGVRIDDATPAKLAEVKW
ncbi:MAG TPA: TolC family protein [Geobacteraceae bacterium]